MKVCSLHFNKEVKF
nr:unnamed protein product [Callosobruchus analis]CAI5818040.1 unnamed protein product [Callosobruchus analis]